jgi:hypothetical protein
MGVEVGTAGTGTNQAGYIYSITRFPNGTSAQAPLYTFGSTISLSPSTGALYLSGIWYDGDNVFYYVKPGTGSVLSNLKAFGMVQFVNTGGNNYNENIRLPRAADGIAMIAMAVSSTASSGSIFGQWNLAVAPNTGGANQGEFRILNSSTTAFSIATATSTATFAANVFAPKYLQVGADQTFFIQQGQTSYLNALQVGPVGGLFDVLTKGPLDDYSNTFTYVHASIANIGDPVKDFNTSTLSYSSYVGTFRAQASFNSPINTATDNYYTLYQAAHRGGYGDGPNYSSQIAIPLTSTNGPADYTRMFFRVKNNSSWYNWSEVFTVGANNQAQGYTIYAQTLYDYADTRYNITPSGTSTLLNLKTYGSISGYLSGTPTASATVGPPAVPALPRLGSAEWIFPSTTDSNIGTSVGNTGLPAGNRTVYREGLYTWKTAASSLGPTGSTTPYYAAVGFGAGSNGAAEIAAYLIYDANSQGQGLHFRTLRDNGVASWSKWTQILNSSTHAYAYNLNQNLRTTDNPTFNSITLTTAPTFGQVKAGSYWITGGDNNQAKFIMPWNGTNQGGFGPYYASPTVDLQSFRFDEVALSGTSPTYQSAYQGSQSITIYLGPNKVFDTSGKNAWHDTVNGLSDTAFYLKLTAGDVSKLGAAEFKNGLTLTGDNITTNQSARLNLTPGRGIWDASYSTSSGAVSNIGTVSTFGPGLNGYDGYVIGGNATAYDVSFVKQSAGPSWGIRGGNGAQWAIWANGGDNGGTAPNVRVTRMSLNAPSAALINSSYSVSIGGTLYCTQNIYAFSDRRKKTNIATIDNALGKVLQLRGVYYHRTDPEPEDIDRREIGVIAQEVLEVLPEAVKHSDHTDEYSVNYGNMAGIFIEAIKDLKKEIDELKAELNMLKGNK